MNDYLAKVISSTQIGLDGMELVVSIPRPPKILAGQFAMLKTNRPDLILRRPLGIASVKGDLFTFIYQLKGEGTRALATLKKGDELNLTLPLGNSFDIKSAKRIAVIGGGYGIIPLLNFVETSKGEKHIYLGFQTKNAIMKEKEFRATGKLTICTDDGTKGIQGFPTEPLEADFKRQPFDLTVCCGPIPLMRKVAEIGAKYNVRTLVSLEQRMGCGVGACLVCTCKIDNHNTRVCSEGAIFDATLQKIEELVRI